MTKEQTKAMLRNIKCEGCFYANCHVISGSKWIVCTHPEHLGVVNEYNFCDYKYFLPKDFDPELLKHYREFKDEITKEYNKYN